MSLFHSLCIVVCTQYSNTHVVLFHKSQQYCNSVINYTHYSNRCTTLYMKHLTLVLCIDYYNYTIYISNISTHIHSHALHTYTSHTTHPPHSHTYSHTLHTYTSHTTHPPHSHTYSHTLHTYTSHTTHHPHRHIYTTHVHITYYTYTTHTHTLFILSIVDRSSPESSCRSSEETVL